MSFLKPITSMLTIVALSTMPLYGDEHVAPDQLRSDLDEQPATSEEAPAPEPVAEEKPEKSPKEELNMFLTTTFIALNLIMFGVGFTAVKLTRGRST